VLTKWESRGQIIHRLLNKLTALQGDKEIAARDQVFNILGQLETLMDTTQPEKLPVVKFVNGCEEAILPG
jgi:hypothetical protein